MVRFFVLRPPLRWAAWAMLCLCAGLASSAAPLRIMPLGDSITMGYGVGGGYRTQLYSNLVNAGYSFIFIGSNPENPSPALTAAGQVFHEGHGGFKVNEITAHLVGGANWLSAEPDLLLLLIGTNDYSQDYDTPNAINRLDLLIGTIVSNRPNAILIVANLLPRTDDPLLEARIQSEFNPFVPGLVNSYVANGKNVHFLDLHSIIGPSDLIDGSHPNKTGYNKMGDAWFQAVHALLGVDTNRPVIVNAVGGIRLTNVTVTFDEALADDSAQAAHFSLSGGASVLNATLNTNGYREILLRTTVLAPGSNYVLTVNNVADRSTNHNLIAPNSTVNFVMPMPPTGAFANVPEAANYTLVYSLNIPNAANFNSGGVPYAIDNRGDLFGGFTRIAYYLELQKPNGQLDYVYASMDAFTTVADRIGVPTTGSGAFFQQSVNGLHVFSTRSDIVTGTNLSGRIEFWPSGCTPANDAAVPNASSAVFDWGDGGASASAGHGSMQIANPAASQMLLAYNGWGSGATSDVGLGNQTGGNGNPDWMFAGNASQYSLKTLQVLVLPALAPIVHLPLNENGGTVAANLGSAGGVFSVSTPTPQWSGNVPPGSGGSSALDFLTSPGQFGIDSPAPLPGLGGLAAFTITGWLNNRSIIQGSGGNCIVTWLGGNSAGAELVYKSDGSLILSVNEVPSADTPRSSAGKIPENFSAPVSNWRFFAVTYDDMVGQTRFYFGSPTADAALDVVRDYSSAGPLQPPTARLAVGNLNPERRVFVQNRMFRGLIDDMRIYGQVLTPSQIVNIQRAAASSTRRLMVASTSPASGVSVGINPADNEGLTNGVTAFTRNYAPNAMVTSTAPAAAGGNSFVKWQRDGVDFTASLDATLTMDADHTLTAIYAPPPPTRALLVGSVNPTSGVMVAVSPLDNTSAGDGTTGFSRSFSNNVSVTLTAPATVGVNSFQKWQRNGVDFSTNRTVTLAMDGDYTLTAIYLSPPPPRTLTVASLNPASGVAIAVSPADSNGQEGGSTLFTRIYSNNTLVTLTAPLTVGSNTFLKWQRDGADYTASASASVTVAANHTLTAVYASPFGPLVRLSFDEGTGTSAANTGSAGGTFGLTVPLPGWTANTPAGVGGSNALDFGTSGGAYAADSAAPISGVAGLTQFTVTGWLNNRSVVQGSGGNRVVSCIDNGGDGFEVVYKGDGSLILSVNQNPDGSSPRSSAGRITEDFFASTANWKFFAATYDAPNQQVKFYFGSQTSDATLDVTKSYGQGAVGAGAGRLSIGHMNPVTRAAFASRLFRGYIDDVQIFDRVLSPLEIVTAQRTGPSAAPPVAPLAAFTGTPLAGSWPLTVNFSDTSSGVITNRQWNFGDGTSTNTAATTLAHTYSVAGNYTATLTVFGPGGSNTLTRPAYIVVTNPPPPVANFTGIPTQGGAPLLVNFTDQSTGPITVRHWEFGDGAATNTTATSLAHTYLAAGSYNVTLMVLGPGGSNVLARNAYVVATNPPPPLANFAGNPTNGSWPLLVTFNDTSGGGITNRFWNFGDGTTLNTASATFTHTYSTASVYTVSLTAQGPGGSDTATRASYITVTNPPAPLAAFVGNPTRGAASLTVNLSDTSTGAITNRQWNFGDGTSTNTAAVSLTHVYVAPGSYSVSLTVRGPAGSDTLTRMDYIVATNSPGLTPIVNLPLNEAVGPTTANLGSAGGVFTLTTSAPNWIANTPPGVGGSAALDFGVFSGNYAVDSAAAISALGGLTEFTITAWVNNRNSVQGSGGNRLVAWMNNIGDGVDLVYRSDGSVDLGVNRPPDGTARSSSGRIPTDFGASQSNWRFLAVTYKAASGQAIYYFGSAGADAALDSVRSHPQGPVGAAIGRLTIGHSNPATRPNFLNRVFRGLIDNVQIYNRVLTLERIVAVQRTGVTGGGGVMLASSGRQPSLAFGSPRIAQITRLNDGRVRLNLAVATGRRFFVLAGTDLANWTALAEGAADASGPAEFTDNDAVENPFRFYQVVVP